ncbi:hypothetical protein ANTHELSMS3_04550 [Antarctobacter heliothermus]|uniref:Uncharacterized protein n=1 Tax=Antarctobacter heliothermus TaxID=74033 RepID=A0A222EAB8_9RHOB|nr:hypothetical protein [Antarctobacter heliothermus]ASP23147.1 hypothetical protein ANTHELSMS3_04550 [Antarctobacter heliothermus]
MKDLAPAPPQTDLRPPAVVMRLGRLGAAFPTRLSFLRVLTRRLSREGARLTRPVWQIDAQGYGHAVYTIALGGHDYSLVAVSTHLPDEMRTDRVIATAWDTAYVLYDGVPDTAEIDRICATAPKQEAARFTERDLILSRANKSVRLFAHVVERLRSGQQPDGALINSVGYLMRTTAVYGNGKFGIADRALIADRPGIEGPFAAEMLTVWMIRSFTHDLVEHLGGAALEPHLKRHLGIGNSTGLGMAPFLVSHPVLLHNWTMARETALARVRAVPKVTTAQSETLLRLADRAAAHLAEWQVPDPLHQSRIELLRAEWPAVRRVLTALPSDKPIDAFIRASQTFSPDTQELCVALVLEPFGEIIDDLAEQMTDPLGPLFHPFESAQALQEAIEAHFQWALALDFGLVSQTRRFWYVSEEKQEPRMGDRFAEPGAERESPLDIARRVQALYRALDGVGNLRAFRSAQPHHELAVMRVACVARHAYCEIRDNLIADTCLPINMLRCKLAFFGATKFDPKSDRWTRITLAQGAPLPEDLGTDRADDWWLAGLTT